MGNTASLRPGDAVRVETARWPDRPHWGYDAVLLGSDAHGDWVGVPAGTAMSRPGREYVAPTAQVVLVPGPGRRPRGWLATFHAPGSPTALYVDVATPPRWDRSGPVAVCRAVDLDLDIVLAAGPGATAVVVDRDEFEEHRVSLGYPADVVSRAETTCATLLREVRRAAAPFDAATASAWLARVDRPDDPGS